MYLYVFIREHFCTYFYVPLFCVDLYENDIACIFIFSLKEGDIIIEEIDDEQIPYFVDALPNNFITPEGLIMNNIIPLDQYLKFIAGNSPPSPINVEDEREANFEKYLELKKIFDTFESQHKNESSKLETIPNVVKEDVEASLKSESTIKEVVELPEKIAENISVEPKVELLNDNNSIADKSNDHVLERSSIGASLLSLGTEVDDDDGEGDFTTPPGSPNASSKHKKRRAPPPPPKITVKSLDESEETGSIKSNRRDSLIETKSISDTESIDSTSKLVDSVSPQTSTEKEKSKSKNRGISKLLHLPSKLAFWNKGEEAKNEPNFDGSEFGSTIDIKRISDFQENNDKIVSNIDSNILALKKLSSSIESINDAFEDANENPTSDIQSVSPETKDIIKLEVTSSETKPENSQHVTYIPLKAESLFLHTESKCTEV